MWNTGWSNQNIEQDAASFGFLTKIGIVIFGAYLIWIKLVKPCYECLQVFIFHPVSDFVQSIIAWVSNF